MIAFVDGSTNPKIRVCAAGVDAADGSAIEMPPRGTLRVVKEARRNDELGGGPLRS
jgi:hypothetical protein